MLESDAVVADMQRQVCSFIDLETACLFALGAEQKVKMAAIHIVSDNPASKEIDPQGRHEASFGEQIQIALAVLTSD
jgi:purine-nucleoside phosphorylase